jgi:tRNA(adenine34) deaminase
LFALLYGGGRMSEVSTEWSEREIHFMELAIEQAQAATAHDDVPIGAVVVLDDEVIAVARNERELLQDPTAHAEVLALQRAAKAVGSWRVLDATLFVTLEPCSMCAGAIVLSRIPHVVYGATDPKAGACGSVLDITGEPRFNHRPEVRGGLLGEACGDLLRAFFAARR